MMNPAAMMQIMTALKKFESTHPKFVAFIKTMFGKGITEGTIIELTVINPGQDPVTTNIRVQQSDLDLVKQLQDLAGR
ncbi:MAG: hypothetical protein IIX48_09970 [Lachnospiraceae bacterium]|nr:hypothetical protein [Lachnospiraceae bacterium]